MILSSSPKRSVFFVGDFYQYPLTSPDAQLFPCAIFNHSANTSILETQVFHASTVKLLVFFFLFFSLAFYVPPLFS